MGPRWVVVTRKGERVSTCNVGEAGDKYRLAGWVLGLRPKPASANQHREMEHQAMRGTFRGPPDSRRHPSRAFRSKFQRKWSSRVRTDYAILPEIRTLVFDTYGQYGS